MIKGIDVSVWQGNIDWNKVKQSGIDFAIIREGFGRKEPCQVDRRFKDNINGAKSAGISVGAYHYSYAESPADAVNEAHFCLENITGYYAMIYTNLNWIQNYLYADELLKRFDLWLAAWGDEKPPMPCGIWQYSDKGKIDGITGNVDLNISYKNYPEIIKTKGLNGWAASTGNAPSATGSQNFFKYPVKKGDTLWDLAKKYLGNGARYKEIKTLNNLSSDIIYAGRTLKIPQ